MGMKKSVRKAIGIKKFKRQGYSYEQIGERIREYKRLGYIGTDTPDLHIDLHPFGPHQVKSEEAPIKKISFWQRIKTAIAIWFEKLFLRLKSRRVF